MERSDVVDFEYIAIEPRFNRIRLARQSQDNCRFVIGILNDIIYTVPYGIAIASGELYNKRMEVMNVNEMEYIWLRSLSSLSE